MIHVRQLQITINYRIGQTYIYINLGINEVFHAHY